MLKSVEYGEVVHKIKDTILARDDITIDTTEKKGVLSPQDLIGKVFCLVYHNQRGGESLIFGKALNAAKVDKTLKERLPRGLGSIRDQKEVIDIKFDRYFRIDCDEMYPLRKDARYTLIIRDSKLRCLGLPTGFVRRFKPVTFKEFTNITREMEDSYAAAGVKGILDYKNFPSEEDFLTH